MKIYVVFVAFRLATPVLGPIVFAGFPKVNSRKEESSSAFTVDAEAALGECGKFCIF